jgi:hypothetical protein
MKATCLNCGIEFEFNPHQKTGKYCSNECAGAHKSLLHKQAWHAGTLKKRIDRPTIRNYLAEDRGYKCEDCGISEWKNKKLTLHVDHINGDSSNDSPENMRLLCPNCHSQTPFLGGANKGRGRKAKGLPLY